MNRQHKVQPTALAVFFLASIITVLASVGSASAAYSATFQSSQYDHFYNVGETVSCVVYRDPVSGDEIIGTCGQDKWCCSVGKDYDTQLDNENYAGTWCFDHTLSINKSPYWYDEDVPNYGQDWEGTGWNPCVNTPQSFEEDDGKLNFPEYYFGKARVFSDEGGYDGYPVCIGFKDDDGKIISYKEFLQTQPGQAVNTLEHDYQAGGLVPNWVVMSEGTENNPEKGWCGEEPSAEVCAAYSINDFDTEGIVYITLPNIKITPQVIIDEDDVPAGNQAKRQFHFNEIAFLEACEGHKSDIEEYHEEWYEGEVYEIPLFNIGGSSDYVETLSLKEVVSAERGVFQKAIDGASDNIQLIFTVLVIAILTVGGIVMVSKSKKN